jgi:heat shock protein HslJ
MSIRFAADGSVSGSDGCNSFQGSAQNRKITIDLLSVTEVGCHSREAQHFAWLIAVSDYEINGS